MTQPNTKADLYLTGPAAVARLRSRAQAQTRSIVGLCGPPGAGKSTLAAHLRSELGGDVAALLPMDGYHLANVTLRRLGLADTKGAINTFDVGGYAAVLARLATNLEPVVYVPEFDRNLEESIGGAIAITQDQPLVIVEGNYLLSDEPEWAKARQHIDEIWYLDIDPELRRKRLVDRHMRYGRSAAEAESWVRTVDEVNSAMIEATSHVADAVIGDVGGPAW